MEENREEQKEVDSHERFCPFPPELTEEQKEVRRISFTELFSSFPLFSSSFLLLNLVLKKLESQEVERGNEDWRGFWR